METLLLISLPGSRNFKAYSESVNASERYFSFQPFNRENHPPIEIAMDEVKPPSFITRPESEFSSYQLYREDYLKLIADTRTAIAQNNWGKVVMSRAQKFTYEGDDMLPVYRQLVNEYPDACVYLFKNPLCGMWIGATPELLLSGDSKKIHTMSMAGTKLLIEEENFEDKEAEEQELVTFYIRQKLQEHPSVQSVEISERQKLKAGNVVHFVNKISAELKGPFDVENFLNDYHPTPAVGGVPKNEALNYIRENENHDRAYYSGYFGLRAGNEFKYFVNLRCMQVFKKSVVLFAGGGITALSDPLSEWEETEAKMQTLLRFISTDS